MNETHLFCSILNSKESNLYWKKASLARQALETALNRTKELAQRQSSSSSSSSSKVYIYIYIYLHESNFFICNKLKLTVFNHIVQYVN